jgi:hypothetical protein
MPKSCHTCKHLRRETESWEMPHIAWYECAVFRGRENLVSFPYKQTKCSKHETRDTKPAHPKELITRE